MNDNACRLDITTDAVGAECFRFTGPGVGTLADGSPVDLKAGETILVDVVPGDGRFVRHVEGVEAKRLAQ